MLLIETLILWLGSGLKNFLMPSSPLTVLVSMFFLETLQIKCKEEIKSFIIFLIILPSSFNVYMHKNYFQILLLLLNVL